MWIWNTFPFLSCGGYLDRLALYAMEGSRHTVGDALVRTIQKQIEDITESNYIYVDRFKSGIGL